MSGDGDNHASDLNSFVSAKIMDGDHFHG